MISKNKAFQKPKASGSEKKLVNAVKAVSSILSTLDLTARMKRIFRLARILIAADAYGAWHLTEKGTWELIVSSGMSKRFRSTLLSKHVLANLRLQEIVFAEDISNLKILGKKRVSEMSQEGIKSVLAIPLHTGKEQVGFIAFYYYQPHNFTSSEESIAQSLSKVASQSIRVATLYREQMSLREDAERAISNFQRHAQEQSAVAYLSQQALSGISLSLLAQMSLPIITETLGSEYVEMFELQPGGKELLLRYGKGWKKGLVGSLILPVDNTSQAGYTFIRGRPVLSHDLQKEKRFASRLPTSASHQARSGLSVVISADGGKYGVLSTFSKEKKRFNKDDIHFLQSVANILALHMERRRLIRDVSRREQEFKALVENAHDIIARIDHSQKVVYINSAIEVITGYDHKKFIGNKISEMEGTSQINTRDIEKHISDVLKTGKSKITEFTFELPTGKKYYQARLEPEFFDNDKSPQSVLLIARDITLAKEEQLRYDHFLGFASHELKTPLASIKGFAELLHRRLAKEGLEQHLSYVARIDQNIDMMTRLINDLLDVTRIRSGKLEFYDKFFDFDSLCAEVKDQLSKAKTTHKIIKKGKVGLSMLADPIRIKQVLNNILTNAVKFSPEADKVIMTLSKSVKSVSISVQDFGEGMSREDRGKIFQAFYQSPAARAKASRGLGLGLYLSHVIVHHYGGHIKVDTVLGKGSVFTVSFPLKLFTKIKP